MANNTNAQAIAFANRCRTFADAEIALYKAARDLGMIYDGRNLAGGSPAILPTTNDPIGVDPENDSAPTVTGNLVLGIIYRANELVADLEADSKAKLASLLAVAPNP